MRNQLSNLLTQEEIFWRQRAKMYWLRDGDSNTNFFHNVVNSRRRSNTISQLVDNCGNIVVG